MKFSFSNTLNSKVDILICPVFEDQKLLKYYEAPLKKALPKLKKGEKELMTLPKKVLFVGLGKQSELNSKVVRDIIAGVTKGLMSKKNNVIAFYYVEALADFAQEVVEALALVNYSPAKYKTNKDAKKVEEKFFKECVLVGKGIPKVKVERACEIAEAVHLTRDLVNGPSNIISVDYFANEAKKIAKQNKYSVTVLDKTAIKKLGMGALLCVNDGSGSKGAKMVILDYKPKLGKNDKKDPILLVGKGLIFDSGGYNLKPSKYIEDMQQDKAGGCVVLGVFKLLKSLGIKRRVVGIVPLTENLIDADAFKPSDIIKTYSGKTVEIRNTDAEGRLILADALSYGIEKYKPEFVIDLATLTGACVVALGTHYAGLMGNDQKLIDRIKKAGDEIDELCWHLPIHDDFKESMKGNMADLRNIDNGTSHLAGAEKAAAFLSFFVGKAKWAHIDIAGVAYNEKPRAFDQPLGTGFGVRLLVKMLEDL